MSDLSNKWEEFAKKEDLKAAELEKFGLKAAAQARRKNAERAREAAKRCKDMK